MSYEYEFVKHLEGAYFRAFFININHRLYHWHYDMEILLIIEGSVIVNTAQKEYVLTKDDIFLVNSNEIHSLMRTKETNTILAIQFDPKFCKAYYPKLQRIKFIERHIKRIETSVGWKNVMECLTDILMVYFMKDNGYQLKLASSLNMMVYHLLEHIPYEETEEGKLFAEEKNLARLNRIINYIQESYMDKLSLKDLAASENLDMFYLSHFIRKQLGISFQQYVNKIRLKKAVDLIMQTDKRYLDICIECGFSDYRYLSKLFLKEYGCTPSYYKVEYKNLQPVFLAPENEEQHRVISEKEAFEKLLKYLDKGTFN